MTSEELLWKVSAEYRKEMEGKIKEEIARRSRVSSHVDIRAAVEYQIEQERERLRKLQDKMEEQDDLDASNLNANRAVHNFLINTLSEFEKEFIARYGRSGM